MSEPEQSFGQTTPGEALKKANLALETSIRRNITYRDKKLAEISVDAALAVVIVSLEYSMRKNIADAAWLEQLPLDPELKGQIQARMSKNSNDWVGLITKITGLPEMS